METSVKSNNLDIVKDNLKNSKQDRYYCKDCDSDPFTLNQKCFNFDKTLGRFHTDQGNIVVP